jgi:hypothetical protein
VEATASMRSRLILNLILVAVLGLLGGYLLLGEDKKKEEPQSVLGLVKSEVQTLEVQKSDEFTLKLFRENSTWNLSDPFRARANQEAIKLILDLISISEQNAINATGDFGFNPPAYTVKIDGQVIEFGSINEVTNEQYVRANGDTLLVKTHYGYNLPYEVMMILDRKILSRDEYPTRFISKNWAAEKNDENTWSLVGYSSNKPINASVLQVWTAEWRTTAATKILRSLAPDGDPLQTIQIEFSNDSSTTFSIYADQDGYLLKRSDEDVMYRVGRDAGSRLLDPREVGKTL